MRSFGNRPDTSVCDEPFYAHYLAVTGLPHPGAEEVIAHHETDCRKVIARLTGPVPDGRPIFYQKHMAHHLLPDIDRGWLERVTNCFLIRDPGEMITSLIEHVPEITIRDTGLPQQVEIFEQVRGRTGVTPPVIDARDVLENPRRVLSLLCEALGIAFTEAMLSWPPGRRPTDGIWARHWYAAVEAATGCAPWRPKPARGPERRAEVHEESLRLHRRLHARRLGSSK